jgi:hypothetical protein
MNGELLCCEEAKYVRRQINRGRNNTTKVFK